MPEPAVLRLAAARATAWGLLLLGWVAGGLLAALLAPPPLAGLPLLAMWLLALAAAAAAQPRWPQLGAPAVRVLAALAAAAGWWASVRGGGLAALALALAATALLTAQASSVVRRCRQALATAAQAPSPRGPAAPAGAAALAALLLVLGLGDLADPLATAGRAAAGVLAAAGGLALLSHGLVSGDGGSGRRGCRAGLFDCALPAGTVAGEPWPQRLAAWAMLPMMAALPSMLALCRAEAWPAPALLALHLAAMFAPAWWLARHPWPPQRLAPACALALGAGAAGGLALEGSAGAMALALGQGVAWSLAWQGRLAAARRAPPRLSPWRAAALQAALLAGTLVLLALAWAPPALAAGVWALAAAAAGLSCLGAGAPAFLQAGRKPSIDR